jgi:two-component system chemotaxis response regulator CheY
MTTAPMLKILVVDDHAEFRRLIVDCLHGYAVECIECADGSTAVSAYAEHQPAWVTMDLEMQVMDGLTAIHRIRESNPQARIVIVTQHDHEMLRLAGQRAGASGFLLKEEMMRLPSVLGLTPSLNNPIPNQL